MKKRKLNYNLSGYLAIIILSVVLWTSVFSLITRYKNYEQIQIFVTSEAISQNFRDNLQYSLNSNEIKDIQITQISYDNQYYDSNLVTHGMLDCDILILPEIVISATGVNDFVVLNNSLLDNYGIDYTIFNYLEVSDLNYGIKIYDSETKINLLDGYVYFSNDESNNYYMFVNKASVNAGDFGVQISETTENAYLVLKEILSLE